MNSPPQSSHSATLAPVPPHAWRALAVGAAGWVIFGFNSTAVNLAFGPIGASFPGASPALVSWVASGFFIASAAVLPLGGRLADRLGRRRIFNIGLIGFVVSAVLSSLALSIWVLIGARVLQAVSGALVIPSSLSMVLPEFPPERRPSAVATWAAAGPLSAAIAPSTAALLLDISNWRWVFFLTAPASLLVYAASLRFVGRSRAPDVSGKLDLVGTGMAIVAIGTLILAISNAPTWGLGARLGLTLLVSAAAAALFLRRSSRHPTPLVDLTLFRMPPVAVANLANLLMSTTSLSIWLVWPLWLGSVWEYSAFEVGLAITVGPICAGSATMIGGRLADRYGQRWLMVIGSAVATGAVVYSIFSFTLEPNYVVGFMPTVMLFGAGWGLSNPSMNSWALGSVDQAVYGEVNAAFNTLRNLGAAIGVATGLALIGSPDRVSTLAAYDRANIFFATAIGLSCVTVTVGSWWISRRPHPA